MSAIQRLIVVMRLLLLVTLVVLSACGESAQSRAAAAGTYLPDQAVRTAPPIVAPTIAYVVSPGTRTTDAPVFLRRSGATDVRIADGMVVRGFAPDVLLVQRNDGRAMAFRARDGAMFSERSPRGGHVRGAIAIGGKLYEFSYDELVVVDQQGGSDALAIPSAIATATGPCRLQKGMFDLRSSGLYAMASVQGHPYLYVATMGNGAIIDIDGGRRLDLMDAGHALSMAEGSDGKLYALTVDGRCASNHMLVRRIDVTTMRVESVIDLGHGLPVEHAGFVVGSHGSTYIHEVTENSAQLLRIDGTGVTSIPLPTDSGLSEAAAPDGTIYLFGGRARNVVTRFDPITGQVNTVDAAKGPDGSFVNAVFFNQAPTPVALMAPSVRQPGDHSKPTARFYRTGGPFVGDAQALARARELRIPGSPVAREEVHLMSYGEVVAWIGSENLYYDRAREMYVVVVSASFEPRLGPVQEPYATPVVCNSYFMVMDATDGTVLSVGCGGPSPWPLKLPPGFSG